MKKHQIIDSAIHQFEENSPFKLKVGLRHLTKSPIHADIKLMNVQTKDSVTLKTEVKNEIRNNDLLNLFELNKLYPHFLLLAQYISKPLREQLRNEKINYLESSGNCFIDVTPFFVFIDNQKSQIQRKTQTSKLNTESGMKLIYALFQNSQLINLTYRQIAEEAEIALGNVGNVLEELQEKGFIKDKKEVRQLQNKEELFNLWANNFAEVQRPHIFQRRLKSTDKNFKQNWKTIEEKDFVWGGEPAAHLLDRFLFPEEFVMYSNLTLSQLMKEYRLIPDIAGDILYMLPPLKNKKYPLGYVDPYLIYAELIQSTDSRCLEAAQRIKENFIDAELRNI